MLIKTKIGINLGLVFLFFCLAVVFTSFVLDQYTVSVNEISTTRLNREKLLLKDQSIVADIHTTTLEYASLRQGLEADVLATLDARALEFYASLEEFKDDEIVDKKSLHYLYRTFQKYYIFSKRFIRRAAERPPSTDSILHYRKMHSELENELRVLYGRADKGLAKRMTQIKRVIETAGYLFGILSMTALLFLFFMSWSMIRSVVRPLRALTRAVEAHESGTPYTPNFTPSNDEIGTISHSFNRIADSLQEREKALEIATAEFQSMFANSWDGMARSTLDGELTLVSPGMAKMFGFKDPEDVHASNINAKDSYRDPATRDEIIQRLLDGEEIVEFELQLTKKDGSILWGRLRSRLFRDQSGEVKGIDTYLTDITAQKREAVLQVAKESAEAANAAKTEFLATMSHEIRTPINAMLGMTEILDETNKSKEQEKCIDTLKVAGSQLLSLINNILSFSEIESGHIKLQSIPFDLRTILDELEAMFAPLCKQKGLEFNSVVPDSFNSARQGDPTRIKQILVNLLGNAVKFTHSGSVRLVIDHDDNDVIQLSVKDTGVGIPPRLQEQIFSPFVQNEIALSRRFGGSGLGLAITKKLVDGLEGEIRVHSQTGMGSTFTVTLPMPKTNVDPHWEARSKESVAPDQLSGIKVLAVDDSEENRMIIEAFLAKSGVDLTLSDNGTDAINLTKANSYDVILMDIEMPEVDGLMASREIRRLEKMTDSPSVPIISVTAHVFDEFKKRSIDAGCSDYLAKPFSKKELLTALARNIP